MSIIINRQTAIDLMKRAVDEKGEDYIYPGSDKGNCWYQKDGAPSCLVGHALAFAGVPIETLERMDHGFSDRADPDDASIASLLASKAEKLPFAVTHAAKQALISAQMRQDRGDRWGYALEMAEAESIQERDSL